MLQREEHFSGTIIKNGKAISIMTYWWATASETPIAEPPPDLRIRAEFNYGDLFMHRSPGKVQLWLSEQDQNGALHWKRVYIGYERADGRRLAFTEVKKELTWLEPQWFSKRRKHMRGTNSV